MAQTGNSGQKRKSTSGRTSSSGRRTSSNSGRKKSSGNSGNRRRTVSEPLDSAAKNEIILIAVLAVCVVAFLCNFGLIGVFGNAVSSALFGIFGLVSYVLPVGIIVFTLFRIFNKNNSIVTRKLAASAVLGLLIMVLCDIITGLVNTDVPFNIADIYSRCSENKNGGGIIGGFFAYFDEKLLGRAGTILLIIVLAIVCLILITGRSLFGGLKEQGQLMVDESIEQKRFRREQNSIRREEKRVLQEEKLKKKREQNDELERNRKLKQEEKENEQMLRMDKKAKGVSYDTTISELPDAASDRISRSADDEHLINIIPEEVINREIDTSAAMHDTVVSEGSDATREITIDASDFDESIFEVEARQGRYSDRAVKRTAENGTPVVSGAHVSEPEPSRYREETSYEPKQYEPEYDEDTYTGTAYWEETDQNDTEAFAVDDDISYHEHTEAETTYQAPVHMNGKTFEVDGAAYGAGGLKPEASYATEYGNTMARDENKSRPGAFIKKPEENKEPEKKPARPSVYHFPPVELLTKGKGANTANGERELRETSDKLLKTLEVFGVKTRITDISRGPAVTRYELQPELGVKVSKIVGLSDDIKLSLAATDIRIEAPIPGKSAVGIEVPNKENEAVAFRDMVESREFKESKASLPFAVGKDIAGKFIVHDIAKMPHVLIAGATGSGKSVCINTIIMSILYKCRPEDVKLIMVDPKVVELSVYNGIPHLLLPVVTDPKKAAGALGWAVHEMTDRYAKFADAGVRDLKGYNAQISDPSEKLPHILIIVDELADLMMVSPGEVEEYICRLAQLARACGIHLVIATQRPSVDVITGLIKANMPSRIAFAVSSGTDSRTILDMVGAEKLLGKGDMLFYPQGIPKPSRVQGAFVPDADVSKVVDYLKNLQYVPDNDQDIAEQVNKAASGGSSDMAPSESSGVPERDSLYAEAGRFIIDKEKASIGALQRLLKIGFNRAARIMDQLAEDGVVGEEAGTKPREILMTSEQFEQLLQSLGM